MSDNKVPLTAKDVAELYASAVKNGTLIAWARLALEWMGHAEAEIVRLCADAPPATSAEQRPVDEIEYLRARLAMAEARAQRGVEILVGIHSLMNNPAVVDKDDRRWVYAKGAAERLQALSDAIRAIPDRLPAPAAIPSAELVALIEAVDTLLESAPCDCPHRMREERGEHLSHCYLFDLNVARSGAGEKR